MSIKKYQTLEAYLEEIQPEELREIVKEIIDISLDVPKQILTFLLDEHDYSGIINISGDEQLSLDIATQELFMQRIPNNLYSLLLGEETDENSILEGTGDLIVLGDFIDGSSIIRTRSPGAIVNIIDQEGYTLAALTVSFTLFLRFDLATELGFIQFLHDGEKFRVIRDELDISPSKSPVFGLGGKYNDHSAKEKLFVDALDIKGKNRYGGCMVQDMNNVFEKTGVFGYFAPKLRFCYEIVPYLYILSKVNGAGFYITADGHEIVFEKIKPLDVNKLTSMHYLHQRAGFVGGSKDLIELWFKIEDL
ncbi:MAG: Fructose-1,6-bisphosphatase class 1 [Candidatus Heimdallarchaeota archaeon AB_125]|nr:MAG: Fructose-1,6-bisphosphatase class 1 [Candidatus Heimdallarchaeota archaeon AB_125]